MTVNLGRLANLRAPEAELEEDCVVLLGLLAKAFSTSCAYHTTCRGREPPQKLSVLDEIWATPPPDAGGRRMYAQAAALINSFGKGDGFVWLSRCFTCPAAELGGGGRTWRTLEALLKPLAAAADLLTDSCRRGFRPNVQLVLLVADDFVELRQANLAAGQQGPSPTAWDVEECGALSSLLQSLDALIRIGSGIHCDGAGDDGAPARSVAGGVGGVQRRLAQSMLGQPAISMQLASFRDIQGMLKQVPRAS